MASDSVMNKYDFSINEENECIVLCVQKYFNIDDPSTFKICECNYSYSKNLLGYLGEHKYCSVKIHHDDKYKIVPIFIKTIPQDKNRADELKKINVFEIECCMYADIFSHFQKREDDEMFFPNILHVKRNEQLFFEDMTAKGFRITDKRVSLDDEHCFVTLKQIGKMHAESLILEEMKTKELNSIYRIKDKFKGILNDYGYIYEGWYYIGVNAALEAAKLSPNMPEYIDMMAFEKKWHEFFKITLNMCKPSVVSRNVLSHRDLWCNNLMYRYDENGKPVQCIFVDFQLCGPMVPAGDVMSFIYLNISDRRRHDNLEKYLKHYYQSLEWELKQNELNVEELVPWFEFRKSCEAYKLQALMQSVIQLQVCLIEGKQARELFMDNDRFNYYMFVSRNELILDLVKNDTIFRDMFMFSVDEIIRICTQK